MKSRGGGGLSIAICGYTCTVCKVHSGLLGGSGGMPHQKLKKSAMRLNLEAVLANNLNHTINSHIASKHCYNSALFTRAINHYSDPASTFTSVYGVDHVIRVMTS